MSNNKTVSSSRSSLLQKNIFASFVIKGWSALIVLLLVPATLHCLGEYKNGIWLTISSLLLWIDNMDIGLGNGLRNKIAEYMAHDEFERTRSLISSTFAMLTCIIIPVLLILLLLIALTDPYWIFNASPSKVDHLDQVLMATVTLVCTSFIFKLIGNFYMGMQLPAVSNLLIALGQTLALIGTYIVLWSGSHSLMLIALVNTVSPLIIYLLAFPYTFLYKYPHLCPSLKLIKLKEAKAVIHMGVQFFIMQISSVVLFMTSNILISNLFSPTMVTPYQITYRYFSILLVIFTVICMPFWNATTDAYQKNDIAWIRNATKKLRLMTVGILICLIVMIALSDIVYAIWIDQQTVIDLKMSIMMATYIFILIYSMRYSYFINGIGKLRLQLIFTTAAAVLFIPLAYLTTQWTHSIIWFMIVMCLVNIPGLIVNRIQFYKLINGKANGIWMK
ncbi:MATE family efflux transporter [Prevotella communis]|uniref:lipopolysaccharide biosynthesis protein n=1 Tax=Prevotella communis TaxID=2913614 RepID=UPI001EDC4DDD|nr:MATE family efflux transporter [Prevotella communis]UKK60216.1 MATE family efflux transporter [Prevotella communis]UKK62950.1 MATE family efflux transporter [Prevotella communis]UKK65775.1 MATE family efflux transporter [Prevotella communis]